MEPDTLKKIVWDIFCGVLKLDPNVRYGSLNRKTLAQWDSLAHVNLLLSLDARFACNLFSQAGNIHSYDDLVRAVSRGKFEAPLAEGLKRICFIGNCHGYNIFKGSAQALKMRRAPFQVLYHHVDHVLQYLARHNHLSSEHRVQAIARDADSLAAGFQRFLEGADILVYSQIFQMEGLANFHLARALLKRFPCRFHFVTMPVPPELEVYDSGPYAAFYTGQHFVGAQHIAEYCPGAEPLDASAAMAAFYEKNGSLSFFTRVAARDVQYELDLTHPQPVFWDYFQVGQVTPSLLGEPLPQLPVPNFKADLAPRLAAIKRQDEGAFQLLSQTSAPNPFVDEALKQLWRENPALRFPIMGACLHFNEQPKLGDLFRQVDWCGENDCDMSIQQARLLDEELVRESNNFNDDEAIQRCVLAFILLYEWSMKHSQEPLQTRSFLDAQLFRREFVYNKRQRFLGDARPQVHIEALRQLRQQILALLDGEQVWMLYGAGTLAAYILACLTHEDPKPKGLVSGYERECGTTFQELPIMSPSQAAEQKAGVVIVATRSWYYPEILQLLQKNGLVGKTFFKFPWRERDPLGGHTLAARLKRGSFTLTWHDGKGGATQYTLQELLLWGRNLVLPVLPEMGGVLPVVLPTSPAVFAIFYYCLIAGVQPTLLSYPTNRRNPEDYGKQIDAVTRNLSAPVLICDPSVAEMLKETSRLHIIEDVMTAHWKDEEPFQDLSIDPDHYAFLQHSSGTTGIQKTVPITHRQALRQLDAYGQALNISSNDCIASWLPLYHDMGLITSLLGPPLWGVDVVACDPVTWIEQPPLILDMIHQSRASLAWWPNFTFAFLARLDLSRWDLSSLRMIVNCSEPVTHEAMTAFTVKAVTRGLSPNAPSACYAMAETTFAVTQCRPDEPVFQLSVNARALAEGYVKPEPGSLRVLMSSGPLLEISAVVILDKDGKMQPPGQIGEICIGSSSLFEGYLHENELDDGSFCEWGYLSGDLGFLWPAAHGLELFVTGRKKDLIIMAGENHYPQDLEREAEKIEGVKTGRSVALGVFDHQLQTEVLIIAVEEAEPLESQARKRVSDEIRRRILDVYGLKVTHALVLPARSMIKSSAGKISRKASKVMILDQLKNIRD